MRAAFIPSAVVLSPTFISRLVMSTGERAARLIMFAVVLAVLASAIVLTSVIY